MQVYEGKQGRVFICRMDYEGDLLDSVRSLAESKNIEAGYFTAIGAVKAAKVSFYSQTDKKYSEHTFNEPTEILSCVGNISRLKGKIMAHAHVILSDKDGWAVGGHLNNGTIIFAGEVCLVEVLGPKLERELDPTTGLNLWKP